MTAATCPHCGAPEHCRGAGVTVWKCGSSSDGMRGWNCDRWVALRASQLKRTISSIPGAVERMAWFPAETEAEYERKKRRRREQFKRFYLSCRRELDRLRGQP